jgi:hypothetical protein
MVNEWLVKLVKQTFEMVSPVEAARLGSNGFHTDDGDPGGVLAEFARHLRGNQLFCLQPQCCFADPGRPKHEDERIRFGSADCIHQPLFGFYEPRMCDREGPKTLDPRLSVIGPARQTGCHQKSP